MPPGPTEILKGVADTNVVGIEVDNSITGHYESFFDPAQKLENLRAFVQKAHEAGQFAFVYIARNRVHHQRRSQ